jgi:hypothetical protein
MAITKARTGSVVKGYYVTTVNNGRIVQSSGNGFGVARLGGLINAQIDGLTRSTGSIRLAAQAPPPKVSDKERAKQHEEWKHDVKENEKKAVAEAKKTEELNKKLGDEAKPSPLNLPTAEVVKDPETNSPRVVAKDKVPAEALDRPVAPKGEPKVETPPSEKK